MGPFGVFFVAGEAIGDGFRLKGFSLHDDFGCALGDGEFLAVPLPSSDTKRMGVGVAPGGGLGDSRPGLVVKLPAEQLLVACKMPLWASVPQPAKSLDDEKEELAEQPGRASGSSLEEALASGGSEWEVMEADGAWTVGSEELLGTEVSSRSPAVLVKHSDAMLSRLGAGDGVEEDGSEWESLEMGC